MNTEKERNIGNFNYLKSKIVSKPEKQHKEKKEEHLKYKAFVDSLRGPGTYSVIEKVTEFK